MEEADEDAVARARSGDEAAFRGLVERHGRRIFRLAYRMTGNEQDAEDVVQETFLRAYRHLDDFEARSQVGSWLYRIAANCAYDVLRGRQRREALVAVDPGEDEAVSMPSQDPTPERLAISAEVRARVRAAMERMSVLERSAFVLRHFEGMTTEEIGRALGLETSATKQSVFRAVRKLRQVLAPMAGAAS
jgi:RNA polymerase sigma-70 factor (ECF subfamily)